MVAFYFEIVNFFGNIFKADGFDAGRQAAIHVENGISRLEATCLYPAAFITTTTKRPGNRLATKGFLFYGQHRYIGNLSSEEDDESISAAITKSLRTNSYQALTP